jgi:hypothetical protein
MKGKMWWLTGDENFVKGTAKGGVHFTLDESFVTPILSG